MCFPGTLWSTELPPRLAWVGVEVGPKKGRVGKASVTRTGVMHKIALDFFKRESLLLENLRLISTESLH